MVINNKDYIRLSRSTPIESILSCKHNEIINYYEEGSKFEWKKIEEYLSLKVSNNEISIIFIGILKGYKFYPELKKWPYEIVFV